MKCLSKYITILIVIMMPMVSIGQHVIVDGKLKVNDMDTVNTEDQLVVIQQDGTLATRLVESLPMSDIQRNRHTDLLLTSIVHNCPSIPPEMIQTLLNSGYTVADLIDFGVDLKQLIAFGITFQELLAEGASLQAVIVAGVPIQDLLDGGVLIADILATGFTVQEYLDFGVTPKAQFDGGLILDSLYGKFYQGGLIFYLDTDTGAGLTASTADQSVFTLWGCSGTVTGADGFLVFDGLQNTLDIEAACTTAGSAADICSKLIQNGYDDWYLPSISELLELFSRLSPGNPYADGQFAEEFYWSSTEENASRVYVLDFDNGFFEDRTKTVPRNTRAIRAF